MDEQTETLPSDEAASRRQRLLDNLAKAREARKAKLAQQVGDPVEAPPPARKPRRKGKRALSAAIAEKRRKAKEPTELAGIRPGPHGACPVACNVDWCVITGENVCGHPHKGGLQSRYLEMKDVLRRFGDARLALASIEADERKR